MKRVYEVYFKALDEQFNYHLSDIFATTKLTRMIGIDEDGELIDVMVGSPIEHEDRIRTSIGVVKIMSFAKSYINFLYALESGNPVIRNFSINDSSQLRGMMYRKGSNERGIPIISTIIGEGKRGIVYTTDDETFFLDWSTITEEMDEKLTKSFFNSKGSIKNFLPGILQLQFRDLSK